MKIQKIAAVTCWLVLLVLPDLLKAQTSMSSQEALKSVRNFVQKFYSWYVPKVQKPLNGPASNLALKYRSYVFSPELFEALKEDSDAQARAREIVGLDFDPFLDTQDPAERYQLGGITQKGNIYLVEVFGVYDVRPSDLPDGIPEVIAEVARRNGQWVFTNFLYPPMAKQFPNSANLLAILKGLKEDRGRSKVKHRAD